MTNLWKPREACALFVVIAATALNAPCPINAASAEATCADPRYREFDFLIGDWEAFGANGKLTGRDRIAAIYDGCALEEHWQGPANPPAFRGGSISNYDQREQRWHQVWVDNQGVTARLSGGLVAGRMVLSGQAGTGPKDRQVRLTWEPIEGGEVRQSIEHSDDRGVTWKTVVTFHYKRAIPPAAASAPDVPPQE